MLVKMFASVLHLGFQREQILIWLLAFKMAGSCFNQLRVQPGVNIHLMLLA